MLDMWFKSTFKRCSSNITIGYYNAHLTMGQKLTKL